MSWDLFFLGKEQDQLTRGGGDPAMRFGMACEPLCLAGHEPNVPQPEDGADASGAFYMLTDLSLATAQTATATRKPSPYQGHQLSRPGQPSSQGKSCAGRRQHPGQPQSCRPRHSLLCVLTFPGLSSQGNPKGKVLHHRDARPLLQQATQAPAAGKPS